MFSPTVASTGKGKKGRKRGSAPRASAGVESSLQSFQEESDHGKGVPNCLWTLRDVLNKLQAHVD
jgi:hypothetical protein